jgi:hypothetical protein
VSVDITDVYVPRGTCGLTNTSRAIPRTPYFVQRDNATITHQSGSIFATSALQYGGKLARKLLVPSLLVTRHVESDGHVGHLQAELCQRWTYERCSFGFSTTRCPVEIGHRGQSLVELSRQVHHLARLDHQRVQIFQRIIHVKLCWLRRRLHSMHKAI